MKYSLPFLTTLFLAPAIEAAGRLHVHNNCTYTMYSKRTGGRPYPSSLISIAAGETWSSEANIAATQALDLFSDDPYFGSFAVVKFLAARGNLSYDLSLENCDSESCPFLLPGASLKSTDATCPQLACPGPDCDQAFHQDMKELPTLKCKLDSDVSLSTCSTA